MGVRRTSSSTPWVCFRMLWKASPGTLWILRRQVEEMMKGMILTTIRPAGFHSRWTMTTLGDEVVVEVWTAPFPEPGREPE